MARSGRSRGPLALSPGCELWFLSRREKIRVLYFVNKRLNSVLLSLFFPILQVPIPFLHQEARGQRFAIPTKDNIIEKQLSLQPPAHKVDVGKNFQIDEKEEKWEGIVRASTTFFSRHLQERRRLLTLCPEGRCIIRST